MEAEMAGGLEAILSCRTASAIREAGGCRKGLLRVINASRYQA